MAPTSKKVKAPKTRGVVRAVAKKPSSGGKAGVNTRWFLDRFEGMGLSQRKFAERVNLHHVLVHRLVFGKRKFSLEDATAFARVLGVGIEEVILQAGIKSVSELDETSTDTIAIKGWVDGDLRVHWEVPKTVKKAPRPESAGRGAQVQVVRFQTGGTKLDALDGALAYFRLEKGVSPDCIGRQCVVQLVDGKHGTGESMLCIVKRGYQPGTHNLTYLNGESLVENALVETASPILWLKFQ